MANVNIECCVVNGVVYYRVYDDNGNFIVSADTHQEAEYEVSQLVA